MHTRAASRKYDGRVVTTTRDAFEAVTKTRAHSFVEVVVFGLVTVIQITYIASFITVDGVHEFFTYFSCWNYVINAVYLTVVCLGMRKWVYVAALLLTPFAVAINTVWVVLTGLIVTLGAPFGAGDSSESSVAACDWYCVAESISGTIYCHVSPLIASVIYFLWHFEDLRRVYRRTGSFLSSKMHAAWVAVLCLVIMWLPWLMFLIYTFTYDPEKRYGYKKPSFLVMSVVEAVMLFLYSVVMGGILFLTYTVKFDMYAFAMKLIGATATS